MEGTESVEDSRERYGGKGRLDMGKPKRSPGATTAAARAQSATAERAAQDVSILEGICVRRGSCFRDGWQSKVAC